MRIIFLILLTLGVINANSEEVTTQNLLSTDFSTGWSGDIDHNHGSNTLATHNGDYVVSDNISLLNDANMTEEQIQYGFDVNSSFEYWHWNDFSSNVQSTISATDSDGNTVTQIRNFDSSGCGFTNCGSYNTGSDVLVVNQNTSTDYDINLRFDFSDTSNSTSHYGVDLKNPSLTITYENQPVTLDNETTAMLTTLFDDFKPEENLTFKDDNKIEENLTFPEEFSFEEQDKFENKQEDVKLEEIKEETEMYSLETFTDEVILEEKESKDVDFVEVKNEEEMIVASKDEEEVIEIMEEIKEEENEEKPEEIKEESDSEDTKESNVSEESNTEQKSVQQKETKKEISIAKVMDKIDEKVKDIDKNLKLKNIVKIKAMSNTEILDLYNVPFYKPDIIYENQVNIQDQRIIYTRVLSDYMINDPIVVKREKLRNLSIERQNLLNQLEVLKNES